MFRKQTLENTSKKLSPPVARFIILDLSSTFCILVPRYFLRMILARKCFPVPVWKTPRALDAVLVQPMVPKQVLSGSMDKGGRKLVVKTKCCINQRDTHTQAFMSYIVP